jgi:hypothetical protein
MTKKTHEEEHEHFPEAKKHPHHEETAASTSGHVVGRGLKADKEEAECAHEAGHTHAAKKTAAKDTSEVTANDAVKGTTGEMNRLANHLVSCQKTEETALAALHDAAQAVVDADKDPDKVPPLATEVNRINGALFALHQAVEAAIASLSTAEDTLKKSLTAPK